MSAEHDHRARRRGHELGWRRQVVEVRGVQEVGLAAALLQRQDREVGEPHVDARGRIGSGQPAAGHVEGLAPAVRQRHDLVHGQARTGRFERLHRRRVGCPGQRREHVGGTDRVHLVLQADPGRQHVVVPAQQDRGSITGADRVDDVAHRRPVTEVREVAEHRHHVDAVQQRMRERGVEARVGIGEPVRVVPARVLDPLEGEVGIGDDAETEHAHAEQYGSREPRGRRRLVGARRFQLEVVARRVVRRPARLRGRPTGAPADRVGDDSPWAETATEATAQEGAHRREQQQQPERSW